MAQLHQTKLVSPSKSSYRTRKNKKQNPDKLVLRKYDKKLRKHVEFTETKKI